MRYSAQGSNTSKRNFFFYFCPPGSGSRFRIRIRIHWPDWIRIKLGSGSATLVKINLCFCPQHLRVVHKTLKSGMTKQEKCHLCHQDYYDLLQHHRRAHKVRFTYLWSAAESLVPGSILVSGTMSLSYNDEEKQRFFVKYRRPQTKT